MDSRRRKSLGQKGKGRKISSYVGLVAAELGAKKITMGGEGWLVVGWERTLHWAH